MLFQIVLKRRTKGELFILGFSMFSLSSYFLSYYISRTTEIIFILGAIFLFSAELSIKGRKKVGKIILFIVLVLIGIYLIYISAIEFINVINESSTNYFLGLVYIIGWILMVTSGGILKLSKII